MHRLLRPLLYYGYKPLLERYLNRNLTWQFRGLQLHIKKGVFHPAFFGSTKVFAAFLASQELAGKSLLEVGCGSGLLSLLAAKQGRHGACPGHQPKCRRNDPVKRQNLISWISKA
jgi:release factor glutamine methyltransferase